MVEQAECAGMTVRLEQTSTPNQYGFRSVVSGACTWTHVSPFLQAVRRPATVTFSNIFHDGLGSGGWPVLCDGAAFGSWDLRVDAGGIKSSFEMDHGDAQLRHTNLGSGVSVLEVHGLHTGTRVVAAAGVFTRTAGGCGESFVEFSGHLVAGDPVIPDPDQSRSWTHPSVQVSSATAS